MPANDGFDFEKVDLKKSDPYLARAGRFRILDVPPQRYLMIDGEGDPNTAVFAEAVDVTGIGKGSSFLSDRAFGRPVTAAQRATFMAAGIAVALLNLQTAHLTLFI